MDLSRFFFHNICALLLGCLIGLERQWHRRNAGLRTNALVSLGAALFVSLSGLLFGAGDQSRIAAQVVSGIGFIGAGLLIKEGMNVSGLNTAATLWCAGAIGTLAGSGFVSEAAIGTGLVIATHLLLRPLGNVLARRPLQTGDENFLYSLRIVCQGNAEQQIRAVVVQEMVQEPLMLQSMESEDIEGTGKVEVKALVATSGRQDAKLEKIVERVSLDRAVTAASWHAMAEQQED
jgi:putative Mg2+ transporter-C (MgtC) family protein